MFTDRKDAGLQLAEELLGNPVITRADRSRLLVLSIPRGGVVVGQAVAQALNCDHNVIVVKKIGFPGFEEMAIGAIAEDGPVILNRSVLAQNDLTSEGVEPEILHTKTRVARGIQLFRQGRPLDVGGKVVILVDDGIATGETMKAAIRWVKSKPGEARPRNVIVAVPVCSDTTIRRLAALVDAVVCLLVPRQFFAVGQFYRHFEQVTDEQVLEILGFNQPSPAH